MDAIYVQGKADREPTETTDKKLAEKIYHKVMTEIAEGKWFEKPPSADKTLGDLLDKYLRDYSTPNKSAKHRQERHCHGQGDEGVFRQYDVARRDAEPHL